jgi:hypothetical protein
MLRDILSHSPTNACAILCGNQDHEPPFVFITVPPEPHWTRSEEEPPEAITHTQM